MRPILVLYGTREGQTHKIAEYIAAGLQREGLTVAVLDAANLNDAFTLAPFGTAILAASVHMGKHEPEVLEFAAKHRGELGLMKAGFVSVSCAQATVENPEATAEMKKLAANEVQEMIDRFVQDTGWNPARVLPVAGVLMYLKYNFLVRWVMRNISKKSGGSTDTSKNTEYTNWRVLDRFLREVAEEARTNALERIAA